MSAKKFGQDGEYHIKLFHKKIFLIRFSAVFTTTQIECPDHYNTHNNLFNDALKASPGLGFRSRRIFWIAADRELALTKMRDDERIDNVAIPVILKVDLFR